MRISRLKILATVIPIEVFVPHIARVFLVKVLCSAIDYLPGCAQETE